MPPFVYRCPKTGLNVQGWVADDPAEGQGETYSAMQHSNIAGPMSLRVMNRRADHWLP
jgi:hypothetical protein